MGPSPRALDNVNKAPRASKEGDHRSSLIVHEFVLGQDADPRGEVQLAAQSERGFRWEDVPGKGVLRLHSEAVLDDGGGRQGRGGNEDHSGDSD